MANDKKKDILLNSFEILNSDFGKNYFDVFEIIGKMAAIDVDIAMDMWEQILGCTTTFVSPFASFDLTSCLLQDYLENNIGYAKAAIAIKSRPKIMEACFNISSIIGRIKCAIIATYISRKDLETANEVLHLVFGNKNEYSLPLGGIFQEIIDYTDPNLDENAIEFLHYWIQQIKDPEEKAKASIRFLALQ